MKWQFLIFRQLIILICFNMLLSACVSNKKYNEAVDQLKSENQQFTQQNYILEGMQKTYEQSLVILY